VPPLEELFTRHHVELYRYVARFTGEPDLAEDVVQDVFVRLARRPPRHAEQMRGWLFRVATTVAIDAMRRTRRRDVLARRRPELYAAGDPAPDPAAALERAEVRRQVREALGELNAKERAILLMRAEGFAHREIAAAVGTTTRSVGTMIARALAKLAHRLDLDGEDR
jgi:RNA polymerase sigma factor (sigma-70 family)